MTKKQKSTVTASTPREREMADLRAVLRADRTQQQSARLAELQAEERRDRFLRLFPRRVERLKQAVRNIMRMGNPASYQYTDEEAEGIVAAAKKYAAEIERAFRGVPKERGLFDL